jgi:hypothetical protein
VEAFHNLGKMVIVVFGDEVKMVYEAHRLFEAGMQSSLCELRGPKRFEFAHQSSTRRQEFLKQLRYIPRIVIGFVSLPVLQISGGKLLFGFHKIVDAGAPKRFKVQEMADLFLCGPLLFFAGDEKIARNAAKHFLEADGSASKPEAEIGKEVSGKGKFEFALEPLDIVRHEMIVDGPGRFSRKGAVGHTPSAADKLDLLRRRLAFAAFFALLYPACMPLVIFKVRGAEPALAAVADDTCGFVAGFVQAGNGFAGGLSLAFAKSFPCRLRFHEAPRLTDCTLREEIGKREN